MTELKATAEVPAIDGWRTWRSDKGRLWANRIEQFTPEQYAAGASRLVDGDDEATLRAEVAAMEKFAGSIS